MVAGGKDGNIRAWEAGTGRQLWQFATGGSVDASPLIAGGSVLAASTDGWLYLVDRQTGRELWSAELGGQLRASPVAAGDTVFIGTPDGRFIAYREKSK